jgi:uncharacterized protein (DUF983 family)
MGRHDWNRRNTDRAINITRMDKPSKNQDIKEFWDTFLAGVNCKCPKCSDAQLYPSLLSFKMKDTCESCRLDLTQNDSADGPAVFLVFVLGLVIVPAALILDLSIQPPMWVHGVLWAPLTVLLSVVTLKPVTSYILALQYKHRPEDFGEGKK